MNVILTGGTGFIGTHLRKALVEKGHKLLMLVEDEFVPGNAKIEYIQTNLLNFEVSKENIKAFKPDAVIHLAWTGIPDYSERISKENLDMSIKFLDFIIDETVCEKILVSGSCFEYGIINGECIESDYVTYNSFISWAKISLYEYLKLKAFNNEFQLIWFRIFYVYGPGQREGSLLPYLISSLSKGEVPNIRTPHNRNDFIYIDDVVYGFVKGLEATAKSGIYNLSKGVTSSVLQICQFVEKQFNPGKSKLANLEDVIQDEAVNFWGNNNKARDELSWEPKVCLHQGLKKSIKFQIRK